MNGYIPALFGMLSIVGTIAFLVHCSKALDAEARRIEKGRP